MKEIKFYIASAFLIVFGGCSPMKPEILISRWNIGGQEEPLSRKLASTSPGQCMKNLFSVETLKEEVLSLEKKYKGQPLSGKWRHLLLSELPLPQANFLKAYGEKIGDLKNSESIDYASCADVPCIFNKIYGKADAPEGYVHYLWYLRFGHLLAADNLVPIQTSAKPGLYNGKEIPLSDYLFSENEIYALWRLSHMLRPPHTNLKNLKEVQRIPRGERFESSEYKEACGLAYSQGYILLTDDCLRVNVDKDQGYIYHAVTHELTHEVDFEEGKSFLRTYRSHKADYLALAGMFIKEFVDEAGKTQRQWDHVPGIKLISKYAGLTPEENFAESIAIFRIDGETAKNKLSPDHANFVSRDYYQNRAFYRSELMASWIRDNTAETKKAVFKGVVDCSNDTTSQSSKYFSANELSGPVLPAMLGCISVKASEISENLRGKVSLYEPEGCKTFSWQGGKEEWDTQMKAHLRPLFNDYLQELNKDEAYFARIQEFYTQVADPTIAVNAFVSCYGSSSEEECYRYEVEEGALIKARSLKLPDNQTREMAQMYVDYHAYKNTREATLERYQKLVASNLDLVRIAARDLWESCAKISNSDEDRPSGNIFKVGDGYMISSMFNCLNEMIPGTIDDVVRNITVGGLKIDHPNEEIILKKEMQFSTTRFLHESYLKHKALEKASAEKSMASDTGELRLKIVSDFTWVTNAIDDKKILADCKRAGYRIIPLKLRYHLPADLYSDWLEKNVCLNISSSKAFSEWLNGSREEFNKKVFSGMEEKITQHGTNRARECLKLYPMESTMDKIRYRKQREACLVDQWPKLEDQVISEISQDPLAIRFQLSQDLLRIELEKNRRRIQLRIIKEFFN